jgi:hypothetical protein
MIHLTDGSSNFLQTKQPVKAQRNVLVGCFRGMWSKTTRRSGTERQTKVIKHWREVKWMCWGQQTDRDRSAEINTSNRSLCTATCTALFLSNPLQEVLVGTESPKCTRTWLAYSKRTNIGGGGHFWIWHSEDRTSWYILIIKPTRCTNLTFGGPCIVIYSYNKTNEMH